MATGGGAILDLENRQALSSRGIVIYLKATIVQQAERTYRDKHRPLLQTDSLIDTLTDMNKRREPLYQEIADLTLETTNRSVREVGEDVINHIKGLKHE